MLRRAFLTGLLCLSSAPAWATLAIDSQQPSNAGFHCTTSPCTESFTNTAGNLLVVACVATNAGTTAPTITAPTYNGVSMSLLSGSQNTRTTANVNVIAVYTLALPATGSHQVSVLWTAGSQTGADIICGAISFSGADHVGAAVNAQGSSATASASVMGTTSGDYVLGFVATGSGVTGTFGSTTISWELNVSGGTNGDNAALSQQTTGGGTVTPSFSVTSDNWNMDAMEVFASTTPPPPPPQPSKGSSNFLLSNAGQGPNPSATNVPTNPPGDNRVACNYYVRPTGGNDSAAGTTPATAFATLTKLQTTLQGAASGNKVGCLMQGSGGSYNLGAGLSFSTADNGEYWETDPASPFNTAVIDGGSAINIFTINTSNFTINGIKFQHANAYGIVNPGGSAVQNNVTIENSELTGNVNQNNFNGMIALGNITNLTIKNNYIHDVANTAISLFAFNAGDTLNGALVDRNVAINTCSTEADCGAYYIDMRNNFNAGGSVTYSNNFARDYGGLAGGGSSVGGRCFYLDDDSSNVTVEFNICGPPQPTDTSGNNAILLFNGGTANTITNNIFDIGSTNTVPILSAGPCGQGGTVSCSGPASPNNLNKNIIVSNSSSASYSPNIFGNGGAFAYTEYYCTAAGNFPGGPASNWIAISNSMYHQYGAGFSIPSNGGATACGSLVSDASPHQQDPLCSGYLYTLANNSPAFSAPMNFVDVTAARAAGPPGFTIPSGTNHSC